MCLLKFFFTFLYVEIVTDKTSVWLLHEVLGSFTVVSVFCSLFFYLLTTAILNALCILFFFQKDSLSSKCLVATTLILKKCWIFTEKKQLLSWWYRLKLLVPD
jgi:hypothetical protein